MFLGLVAVPVLVAGVSYAWIRRRASQPTPRVFRCPACSQQIRFTPSQVGARGHCPRCWKPVTPPKTPDTVGPAQGVVGLKRPVFGRLSA